MKVFFFLLLMLSTVHCTTPSTQNSDASLNSQVPSKFVEATHGAVAAAHPLASEAGALMLKKGGNAVDAAVASSFAISVLRPQSTGIGGGGFALQYSQQEGKVRAYDFRERAPRKANRGTFVNKDGSIKDFYYQSQLVGPASKDGHLAVGVPGLVAGLVEMHKRHGSLPLRVVMEPAIFLAEHGFEVYPSLSEAIRSREAVLRLFPESRKIFLPNDKVPSPRDILVQKDLAQTLRLIAARGKNIFYYGDIAQALVNEMKKGKGLINKEDMKRYQVIERETIEGSYRSYKIVGMPPPSSGGVHIIQILNMLSADDIGALQHNSTPYLHLLAEAMRRAFADRASLLGDPKFFQVPLRGLLSKNYALKLRQTIDLEKASPSNSVSAGNPVPYESPSTTHISMVDQWGNAVSTTQTVNDTFGSGLTVKGIVLNNEMDDFSVKPGVPNSYGLIGSLANSVEPGKTMLSSMSPTLVFDEKNSLKWVLGSPGGPRIITATLQTLINLIDFKLPLNEAVQAPRIHHQWLPDMIAIEKDGISTQIMKELEAKGHTLRVPTWYLGDVQAIERLSNGNCLAVSDKRSDGLPAAFR